MTTVFDWVAVVLFAALVVLYLQRSTGPAVPGDHAWLYLPPALGCALANYLGNGGHGWAAGILLLACVLFTVMILKPFGRRR
jgi:hypothetical protein